MATITHVQGNVLRLCIPLTLRVVTMADGVVTETDSDFIPNTDYPVRVIFGKGNKYPFEATMIGNVAHVTDGGSLPIGVYSVTVLCRNDDGEPMRFKQDTVLNIVDTTAEAGIEPGVEYQAETHYLDAAVFLALGGGGTLPDGIVIDPDYVHTDNNFTDEYKEMLDNGGGSVTFDDTPTSGSGNAVKSGGVYTALEGKANASHTHTVSDVTGLQTVLDDLQDGIDGKQDTLTSFTALGGVNGKTLNYGGAVALTGEDIPLSGSSSTNVKTAIALINNNLAGKQDTLSFGTGLSQSGNEVTVNTASAIASGETGYATGGQVYTALAGKQDTIAKGTATIAVSDWNSNAVTVKATGVTASNVVIVSPDSASMADYAAAGVQCTAQGANELTFTCTSTPTSSLTINFIAL